MGLEGEGFGGRTNDDSLRVGNDRVTLDNAGLPETVGHHDLKELGNNSKAQQNEEKPNHTEVTCVGTECSERGSFRGNASRLGKLVYLSLGFTGARAWSTRACTRATAQSTAIRRLPSFRKSH